MSFTRPVPLVEQELLTLSEHLSSLSVLVGFMLLDLQFYVYVLQIVVCPFVLFLSAIVLSVLRYTDSDCPFGIFKLFLPIILVVTIQHKKKPSENDDKHQYHNAQVMSTLQSSLRQGRPNSIVGPRTKTCTGYLPTQPLTGIKRKWSIKLNLCILYWYLQQNQCLNIKTHAVHNIHRLACPCLKITTGHYGS